MELELEALEMLPGQEESDLRECQPLTCPKYGTFVCSCTFTVGS